jgi:hypothetical protein
LPFLLEVEAVVRCGHGSFLNIVFKYLARILNLVNHPPPASVPPWVCRVEIEKSGVSLK